eukprot:GEMP01087258.1.p1 GENE.GEMP01087258.1~~GEMP01087258.1.p1  ORF type:complete len:180 (+),score=39.22 GEMP01087258.1:25-564(+)
MTCPWAGTYAGADSDEYQRYHDEEWGRPVHDDRKLFEMLILETAQAGLSWATILKKRENFRAAYDNFDVLRVAKYGDADMNRLLLNEGIIRNRRKIEASIHNAKIVLDIQKKWTSFSRFLWSFVDGQPVVNRWDDMKDVPATTALSDKVSKELKRIGMKFIGSTTGTRNYQISSILSFF